MAPSGWQGEGPLLAISRVDARAGARACVRVHTHRRRSVTGVGGTELRSLRPQASTRSAKRPPPGEEMERVPSAR